MKAMIPNSKILNSALHSFFNLSTTEAEKAISMLQPVIQHLEQRLGTQLKLRNVIQDKASRNFELYLAYQSPLISVAKLLEHEHDIVKEISRAISALRDIKEIRDSWTSGFGISVARPGSITIYLTINSHENPMSIEDLITYKNTLMRFA